MPPRLTFEIRGAQEIINKLSVLGEQSRAALGRAIYRFAETDIAARAKAEFVPVVTGALRSSIYVTQEVFTRTGVIVYIVAGGAAAPYAMKVHENPRSGRTGGFSPSGRRYKRWSRVGQWKYLEQPALEAANNPVGLIREAGAELEAVIRGLSH